MQCRSILWTQICKHNHLHKMDLHTCRCVRIGTPAAQWNLSDLYFWESTLREFETAGNGKSNISVSSLQLSELLDFSI